MQDGIAVLDDLLLDALEGLQVQAQLDTGTKNKAVKPLAMKVCPRCQVHVIALRLLTSAVTKGWECSSEAKNPQAAHHIVYQP